MNQRSHQLLEQLALGLQRVGVVPIVASLVRARNERVAFAVFFGLLPGPVNAVASVRVQGRTLSTLE